MKIILLLKTIARKFLGKLSDYRIGRFPGNGSGLKLPNDSLASFDQYTLLCDTMESFKETVSQDKYFLKVLKIKTALFDFVDVESWQEIYILNDAAALFSTTEVINEQFKEMVPRF